MGNSLSSITPNLIENLDIIKRDTLIGHIKYIGQAHITTKSNYAPNFITLTALKDKYIKLKNKTAVFMLNGNIINTDHEQYFVDENDIFQIVVDDLKNSSANIDLGLIKIFTKTEENINQSKKIIIRGN